MPMVRIFVRITNYVAVLRAILREVELRLLKDDKINTPIIQPRIEANEHG